MAVSDQLRSGSGETGAQLRAIAPPGDAVAAKLRERLRASLTGRSEEVSVGRYVLGERLGAGGMGTVYRARDQQLQRDVALKLIPLPPEELVERTIAEARAMAGITHPNVVEVFDVGTTDRELYIVMRLVEGATLRAWASETRGLGELLDALLAAGEGLAAAHAAGFIHHDFKPDNVLVATDGQVAVTDFGLAAVRGTPTEESAADRQSTEDTQVGGTRGYAAPERQAGQRGDARSDQFSFCVTAYELLFGHLPEAGQTPPRRSERPGVDRIPSRVRRALARGLVENPRERFVDMRALLVACRPVSRRRALIASAVLIAAGAVALYGVSASTPPPDEDLPLGPSVAEVEPEVSEEVRQSVQDAIDASTAARKAGKAEEALRHAERAQSRADAEPVNALRPAAYLALGGALELSTKYSESATAFNTAVELALARGDDDIATRAASELVWIHGTRLNDPTAGRRWAKTGFLYLERGGDFLHAAALHYALANLATQDGDYDVARDHFEQAIVWDQGELVEDPHSIALSHMGTSNVDLKAGNLDAAAWNLERARALLSSSPRGDSTTTLSRVHSLLGQIAYTRAMYGEALDHFDEALALLERAEDPYLGYELCNSARLLMSMKRYDEALERAARGLASLEANFGEMSVETTMALAVLADAHVRLHDLGEAERFAWRSVVVLEATGRNDAPALAGPLMKLGEIALARGDRDKGIAHLERSLAVRRKGGMRPASIAATLMALARGLAEHAPADAKARALEAVDVLDAAGLDASSERRFLGTLASP